MAARSPVCPAAKLLDLARGARLIHLHDTRAMCIAMRGAGLLFEIVRKSEGQGRGARGALPDARRALQTDRHV